MEHKELLYNIDRSGTRYGEMYDGGYRMTVEEKNSTLARTLAPWFNEKLLSLIVHGARVQAKRKRNKEFVKNEAMSS